MPKNIYTAMTFAPVEGFIQGSRKLRDLYGSTFILSFLAKAICEAANEQGYQVVSPALITTTQGTPNQIIISGNTAFPKEAAKSAFYQAWKAITKACQQYIEELLPNYNYQWQSHWNTWTNHAWEFFYAAGKPGETITDVRQKLNKIKYQRAWVGINWMGESSTLSGKDAVAWYGMSNAINLKITKPGEINDKVCKFYQSLSQKLSNSIINESEQLSIPELTKRLITLRDVAEKLNLGEEELPNIEIPLSFKNINRKKDHLEENRYTGWFQGDGDKIGDYLQSLVDAGMSEKDALHSVSKAMMEWGSNLKYQLPKSDFNAQRIDPDGRILYAGGDDFLGVLYRNYPEPALTAFECLQWFYKFPEIWQKHKQNITVSIGFVWAAPGVPQRDVLQHCQEAERSAKSKGRDRLAIRILFNSGTHIEWVCPWWWLETLLTSYRDKKGKNNWTHIYKDVVTLESRHGFHNNRNVALGLFEIYFGKQNRAILENPDYWWNYPNSVNNQKYSSIFGEEKSYQKYGSRKEAAINQAINHWVISLAKVGFYLHRY